MGLTHFPASLAVQFSHVSMFALKDWEKKLFLPLLGQGLKTWVCPPYTIFLALGQPSFDHSWGKYLKGCWRNQTEGICMASGKRASQWPEILISYCYIRNKPWGERCALGATMLRTWPLWHLQPGGFGSIRGRNGHSHLSSSLRSFPSPHWEPVPATGTPLLSSLQGSRDRQMAVATEGRTAGSSKLACSMPTCFSTCLSTKPAPTPVIWKETFKMAEE